MKIPFPKTGLLLYAHLDKNRKRVFVAKTRLGNLAKRGKL